MPTWRTRSSGFHAQQAAEKLIKAVLAARDVTFVKSHALSYLIGLVEENDIETPHELSEADVLSPWAVEFRYEGEEPPALDRSAALVLVAQSVGRRRDQDRSPAARS